MTIGSAPAQYRDQCYDWDTSVLLEARLTLELSR
jgi:hypothetical protein